MLMTGFRSFQRGAVVSAGQRAAKLQAVKVGGLKKIRLRSMCGDGPGSTPV